VGTASPGTRGAPSGGGDAPPGGTGTAGAAVTGIVTKLTVARVALVFFLTLGMCFVAGLLVVRKAIAVDPAELF